MMKKPNTIAIEIMAGKPKEGYDDDTVAAHVAVCPNCGHEFTMGEEPEGEESEDESEEY